MLKEISVRLSSVHTKLERVNRQIAKFQEGKVKLVEEKAKKESDLRISTEKAQAFCPERVDTDKTPEVLDREISALDARIRREQQGCAVSQ